MTMASAESSGGTCCFGMQNQRQPKDKQSRAGGVKSSALIFFQIPVAGNAPITGMFCSMSVVSCSSGQSSGEQLILKTKLKSRRDGLAIGVLIISSRGFTSSLRAFSTFTPCDSITEWKLNRDLHHYQRGVISMQFRLLLGCVPRSQTIWKLDGCNRTPCL